MEVIIRPDAEAAADLTARLVQKALQDKPRLVLGLATGRTMESVYRRLVEMHCSEKLDFSGVATFNLDEYVGLASENSDSYRHYMERNLFQHVNLRPSNVHLPDGIAVDLDAECVRYEQAIRDSGGIDLQLLGIGSDGHIGFNEPLSALQSRTRVKALTPATIEQNAWHFSVPEKMPRRALTMGVGTILECRRCILLATGEAKAEIIAAAVEGPITSMISASALQLHPHCTIIVDQPAGGCLRGADYYRWIFDNEPEWEPYRGARQG